MKKIIILFLLMIIMVPTLLLAQNVTYKTSLKVENISDKKWITRYQSDIDNFINKDKNVDNFVCDVMFVGSSSIRLWQGLEEDMAPLNVVNRGYGGATLRDILYNYKSVFSKYKPKAIVIYCDNDICMSDKDITLVEYLDLYRALFKRIEKDYINIPIYYLSIKYSTCRENMRQIQYIQNELMKDYAKTDKMVNYIDVNSSLLDDKGNVRDELFKNDKLHLNRQGYKMWVNILKPLLLKNK